MAFKSLGLGIGFDWRYFFLTAPWSGLNTCLSFLFYFHCFATNASSTPAPPVATKLLPLESLHLELRLLHGSPLLVLNYWGGPEWKDPGSLPPPIILPTPDCLLDSLSDLMKILLSCRLHLKPRPLSCWPLQPANRFLMFLLLLQLCLGFLYLCVLSALVLRSTLLPLHALGD